MRGSGAQLSRCRLLAAYRRMRTMRAVCEAPAFAATAPSDRLTALGTEAGLAGLAIGLDGRDLIAASERHPALAVACGVPLLDLVFALSGLDRVRAFEPETGALAALRVDHQRMLTALPEEGVPEQWAGTCPSQAVGAALARIRQGGWSADEGPVAVVMLEPLADQDADVWDAICTAKALSLPVLFVIVRDERGATGAPRPGQAAEPASACAARAKAMNVATLAAKGHDFFSVQHAADMALSRLRQGEGPLMLDLACLEEDPLALFRRRTIEAGLFDAARLDGVDRDVRDVLSEAVNALPGVCR